MTKSSFAFATARRIFRHSLFLLSATLITSTAWTKVQFDANQLRMKDSEEVNELIRVKIKKAQDIQATQADSVSGPAVEPEAIEELKDAMRIALSRPDQDGNRQHAFARLRRELNDLRAFESGLEDLTKEAIFALEAKDTEVRIEYTYIVFLENLMAEIKPEVGSSAAFKRIVEKIRDADIKVSDKAKSMQRMRSMSKPLSPSEIAEKILPKKK